MACCRTPWSRPPSSCSTPRSPRSGARRPRRRPVLPEDRHELRASVNTLTCTPTVMEHYRPPRPLRKCDRGMGPYDVSAPVNALPGALRIPAPSEDTMTPPDSFTTSGSSPPVDDTDTPPLPPDLVEALATLLADALVADICQFPNLAELQRNHELTVESPSGHHRRPSRTPRPASRSSRGRRPSTPPGCA